MVKDYIYLDNAATTAVRKEVLKEMMPYFTQEFGNTLSIHKLGRGAKQVVEESRKMVADALNCSPREVYFTSGATEADNWAVKGYALKNAAKGNHIITSSVEHKAIMNSCSYLEKKGYRVSYLPVDEFGRIRIEDLEEAICDETILISIMTANNEVGTIMPTKEIGAVCKEHKIAFHCDAVQSVGKIPTDVKDSNIDMLSLSAHKFNGPKGVGALYIKKGIRLENILDGGGHEQNKRAGTLNHVGIVGLGSALKLSLKDMEEESKRQIVLRDKLINGIFEKIKDVKLNGHPTQRLPNNVNMSFRYIEGEALLLSMDMVGIGVSSGSACTSGSLDPSHVLLAMGMPHEIAHGSLRMTLGHETDEEDIDKCIRELIKIVERLRAMSPLL